MTAVAWSLSHSVCAPWSVEREIEPVWTLGLWAGRALAEHDVSRHPRLLSFLAVQPTLGAPVGTSFGATSGEETPDYTEHQHTAARDHLHLHIVREVSGLSTTPPPGRHPAHSPARAGTHGAIQWAMLWVASPEILSAAQRRNAVWCFHRKRRRNGYRKRCSGMICRCSRFWEIRMVKRREISVRTILGRVILMTKTAPARLAFGARDWLCLLVTNDRAASWHPRCLGRTGHYSFAMRRR